MRRIERIRELFTSALDEPAGRRSIFLERACAEAPLRSEVMALLSHHERAGDFMSRPAAVLIPRTEASGSSAAGGFCIAPQFSPGDRVGGFRIIKRIGSGGQGTVYEARQESVERDVALKVMIRGLKSRTSLDAFKQEAKLAAGLQHQHINRIIDFGIHEVKDNELPFIAMELVSEGKPITAYAEDEKLDLRQRLGLFVQVCDAISHAHDSNVVHRDLKPRNILVDKSGCPRVIDFGVARAIEAGPGEAEGGSRIRQIMGTLQYMSPQQAAGDVDEFGKKSDQYGLGVVLFQMLCGKPPYEVSPDTVGLASKVIEQAFTPKPSVINPAVPDEIDAIVLKVLEKDPSRRFESVPEFKRAIRDFLDAPSDPPVDGSTLTRLCRSVYGSPVRSVIALLLIGGLFPIGYQLVQVPDATLNVTVDGGGPAAVFLEELSPSRQQVVSRSFLGTTPLNDQELPPGDYRVVVSNDVGYSEMTRRIESEASVVLAARIRPTDEVVENMIRIEGGAAILGNGVDHPVHPRREVMLEPFFIDSTEVSNQQYLEFLQNTGWPAPVLWAGELSPGWESLPVVAVTVEDARAYAEWAGKRLPMDLEWERAARGTDGRRFPWGDQDEPAPVWSNVSRDQPSPWQSGADSDDLRAQYVEAVVAVDELPGGMQDRGPEGLLHAFGNVSEWTDSLFSEMVNGELKVIGHRPLIKGGNWGIKMSEKWGLGGYMMDSRDSNAISRGFRCAKGSRPERR